MKTKYIILYIFLNLFLWLTISAQNKSVPAPRMYHSMVYHEKMDKFLLFGGHSKHGFNDDLRDVWSYDLKLAKWVLLGKYKACPDTIGEAQSAVYNSRSNIVLAFNTRGETWIYHVERNEWKNMNPTIAPSSSCGHMTVYHAKADRIVLFGGFACKSLKDSALNDTWSYDYKTNTWEEMKPKNPPPGRMYAALIYNTKSNTIVLWGGVTVPLFKDKSLWEYEYEKNEWKETFNLDGPEVPYAYPSIIYDKKKNEMIIFGGAIKKSLFEGIQLNSVWKYRFNDGKWFKEDTKNPPAPVTIHTMVLHPKIRKAVLFGGEIEQMYSNHMLMGTWIFDIDKMNWEMK